MFALLISFTSCENENVKKIKREVKAINDQCPIKMGPMGDLLSIKYDENDNEVQIYYAINEENMNIDALKNNEQLALQSIKFELSKHKSKELLKTMIDAGTGLSYTYKGKTSGKTCNVKLSVDDLKKIKDNPVKESDMNKLLLENLLAIINASCPETIDDGMVMIKAFDDGENVIYVARIDEDLYDLSSIEGSISEVKNELKEIMISDPEWSQELYLLKALGKGFIYRYSGETSGKTVDVTFSPSELKNL